MIVFVIGVLCIVAGGLATLVFPDHWKGWILAGSMLVGSCSLVGAALPVLLGESPTLWAVPMGVPIGKVQLVIDPLSAWFILLIAIISPFGVVYGIGYLRPYYGQQRHLASHYVFLSVFIAAMLGVVVVQNALAFLIAWEIMSFSSFFLVIFEHEREDVLKAGLNYLIAMHVGVCFLIGGFGLLMLVSGSADFASFAPILQADSTSATVAFLLLFAGFGMKAGFLPLHFWLPQAHPAAPSHVSGMMSGIMIKTGIYGILRMLTLVPVPPLSFTLLVLGIALLSAIIGVIYALAQDDLKKLLAYSSVENIGLIGVGIGIGMLGLSTDNRPMALLGFAGALLHVFNHAIFKMLLFYGAGAVYQQTHTRRIELLGGLVKPMRLTSIMMFIGALAISGLPMLNGFISEFLLYFGRFHGLIGEHVFVSVIALSVMALLAFVGALALACFTRLFGLAFLGSPRSEHIIHAHEVGPTMLWPMAVFSGLSLLIGLFPHYALRLIVFPIATLVPSANGVAETTIFNVLLKQSLNPPVPYFGLAETGIFNILAAISRFGVGFVVLCTGLYVIRTILLSNSAVTAYKTWDCGYQAGNTRMQYTGSSFAEPLLSLMKPFVQIRRTISPPEGLFPKQAHYSSHSEDVIEEYAIQPILATLNRLLGWFTWIQSGSTQKYILYGVVFLLITLAAVFGIR